MRQTAAIFLDAYRELNAKKLFWITMILSGLVVVAFAAMGNNEKGITIFHWTIELPFSSTKVVPRDEFYKMWFVSLGLKFWLGWIASILALVSTASMIPDFLAGGAIELSLSKPIGRLRLFLTKKLRYAFTGDKLDAMLRTLTERYATILRIETQLVEAPLSAEDMEAQTRQANADLQKFMQHAEAYAKSKQAEAQAEVKPAPIQWHNWKNALD